MYTVTTISQIDCYKRAETFTNVVYSGGNSRAAYAIAVDNWIENFAEIIDYFPSDSTLVANFKELAELKDRTSESYYTNLHDFFEENANEIWRPEYINQPTFEVSISNSKSRRAPYKSIIKSIDCLLAEIDALAEEQ